MINVAEDLGLVQQNVTLPAVNDEARRVAPPRLSWPSRNRIATA
jgi:hypothetical protein